MNEQKGFLILLISALGVISAYMLKPFVAYILGAGLLAFMLIPLHRRLKPYIGEKLSAMFLVLLSVLVVVVPMVFTTVAVVEDAGDLASRVDDLQTIDLAEIDQRFEELAGLDLDLESSIEEGLRSFMSTSFGGISQIVNIVANVGIGLSIMLFLQYYLIKDGPEFIEWLKKIVPLPDFIQDRLYERTTLTTWAVIKGHILVALAQGGIAGIGLYIAGVPNPYFWTFIMTILAFLPLIGSFLVWGPASFYLLSIDQFEAGIFLLLYGLVVVNLTDNFLRPIVVDRSAELHPAVILIGVIGGVYLLGAPGLFIGPIILGIFKAALVVFSRHYDDL